MIYAELLETRIKTKIIYRVLEFNQSKWLKPYIEFNTQKRIEATKKKKKKRKKKERKKMTKKVKLCRN